MKCFQIILLLTFTKAVINFSINNCIHFGNPFMALKIGPCEEKKDSDYTASQQSLGDDSNWLDTNELSKEANSDYWLTSEEIRDIDWTKSYEDPTDADYWLRSEELEEIASSDYWKKSLEDPTDSDYWSKSDELEEIDSSDYWSKTFEDRTDSDYWSKPHELEKIDYSFEDPTDSDYWLRSDELREIDSSDYWKKSLEDLTDSDYWLRPEDLEEIDSSDYWTKTIGDRTDSDYWSKPDELEEIDYSFEDPTDSDYWLRSGELGEIDSSDYWKKSFEDSNESMGKVIDSSEIGEKERHPKKPIPYMVSFQRVKKNRGAHFCAGAIIGAFHAVSAAHCFDMLTPREVYAVVGSMSVLSGDAHNVSHIYRHPKYYKKERLRNNIAVIKVQQPFNFENRNIKPIRLATRPVKGNVKVENVGWDKLAYKLKDYPATLKISVSRTLDNRQCSRNIPKLSKHTLCISGRKGRTCKGDSGSPLVTANRTAPKLVGINIMKKTGCSSKLPPVFIRVQSYLKFINDALQK